MPACPVAPQTLELDDEQAAPLIRGSYLAPERSRIRGDVDGVLPVLRTGTTAPVTVKTGEGVDAARLKFATEHITIGHRTSMAWQTCRARSARMSSQAGRVRGAD